MTANPENDPNTAAIEQLERFGLSTYAARTFVALVGLGTGTAREVSQISEVPRTRVYDAVDELHREGLVDIRQSNPKEFYAISAETTGRKYEQELHHRVETLLTALSEIEPIERQEEQRGVWTVEGQGPITDRVLEFVAAAEDEIVFMTVEDLLTQEIIEALGAAADRDVSIKLGGVSTDVQADIQDDVPGAELFDSLWMWSDTPAGRLMMVDGTQTLVSALVNGEAASPSDPRAETAIWGSGEKNSLVVVLKAIFTWRLASDAED